MSAERPAIVSWIVLLFLVACSPTGTVTGRISIESGPIQQGAAGARVFVIPAGEAFEREWQPTVDGYREVVRPALERQRAAERAAEQARRTWDRAMATPAVSGISLSQWNRSAAGRQWERQLWTRVQRTAIAAYEARQQALQVLSRQSERAQALLQRYAIREVTSGEEGQYLITELRPGKAYLFARLKLPDRDVIWFRLVELTGGRQQVDLTERDAGGWPFAPGI